MKVTNKKKLITRICQWKILVQLYFSLFSIEAYYDPLADSEKNLRNSIAKVYNFSDRLEWYILEKKLTIF